MKRYIAFFCIVFLLIGFCAGCASPMPEKPETNDKQILTCGWDLVLTNGQYLVGEQDALLGLNGDIMADVPVKYNLQTHVATPLCVDELCTHEKGSSCPFQDVVLFCFMAENQVYFLANMHRVVGNYEQKGEDGSVTTVDVWEYSQDFIRYDIQTGEHKTLLSFSPTETNLTGGRFAQSGDTVMYLRYLPLVDKPKNPEDYELAICSFNLKTEKEERVAAVPAPLNDQYTPLFFRGDAHYFWSRNTNEIYRVTKEDAPQAELLLNGRGEQTVAGGYDGIFLQGSYLYYPVFAKDVSADYQNQAGLFLYRLNLETGKYERLSDELVERFNLTDKGLVCLLSEGQLEGYSHENEPVPGPACSPVVRFSQDGQSREYLGYINKKVVHTPFFSWVAGEELFLYCMTDTYRFSFTDGQVRAMYSDDAIPQS